MYLLFKLCTLVAELIHRNVMKIVDYAQQFASYFRQALSRPIYIQAEDSLD